MTLLKRTGGGGGTVDAVDDDEDRDTTNLGDLGNDVRANVAGYDQEVEESASGADTNDIETMSMPGKRTIIDPDTSNDDSTDQVGVDVDPDTVSVTTVDQGGESTSTTTTDRRSSPSTTSTTDASDRNNPQDQNDDTPFLERRGIAGYLLLALVVAGLAGMAGWS